MNVLMLLMDQLILYLQNQVAKYIKFFCGYYFTYHTHQYFELHLIIINFILIYYLNNYFISFIQLNELLFE